MKKVLALVGESGSGKTTIAEELRKQGYHVIDSYTTRQPRSKDETGHIFVDIEEYRRQKESIVAYTHYDGNHYWTNINQFEEGWNIYVIDPKGIDKLYQDNRFKTVGVHLKTEECELLRRMLEKRKPESALDRLRYDKYMFKLIKCNYAVDNNGTLEETVKMIKYIMEVEE